MSKSNFGLESIKRQDNALFDALTECMRKLRNSGDFSTTSIKKSLVSQVIKEHTGLNIVFYIEPGFTAHIYPCRMLPQHVFQPGGYGNSLSNQIIDVTKTALRGTVDIVNVRVTGIFSEIASELFIGTALFEPGLATDRQIAAVVLHEIGHAFTYIQFISTIAFGSLVVQQTVNNIFLTDDYQTKKICIKTADEILGVESDNRIEDWIDTTKENLEVILVTRLYSSLKSRSSTSYYDVRNCEQLADMFAAKHGAAVELAKFNYKVDKILNVYGNKNFFVHILRETGHFLGILMKRGVTFKMIMLSMDQPKKYDDPKDRIAFLKFHLIDDLKHLPSGNNKSRSEIVSSIIEIDEILNSIKERRGVLTYIHNTMRTFGKSAHKQEQQQKQLEEMLYNNLFFQSAKLKTLN